MKPLLEAKLSSKWNDYREFMQRKSRGVNTGIKCLDEYLLGLGGLVNIQGETSSCKSSLALQIAHYNMRQGMPCIMIDKENGEGRVITRMLCQGNRISEAQLKKASAKDKSTYQSTVNTLPLYLYTESVRKMEYLDERVKECIEAHKAPVMLLFDSIQACDRLSDDQRVNLETWVYYLDSLKLKYQANLTIIFVSEKNRSSYGQSGIGGGKGSNILDYKPETVLDIKWDEPTDKFWVKVSKHRDGIRGAQFELQKVFSVSEDKRSFCFLLEEADSMKEEAAI